MKQNGDIDLAESSVPATQDPGSLLQSYRVRSSLEGTIFNRPVYLPSEEDVNRNIPPRRKIVGGEDEIARLAAEHLHEINMEINERQRTRLNNNLPRIPETDAVFDDLLESRVSEIRTILYRAGSTFSP